MEAEKQRLVAQKFEQKARTGDVMIQEKTTFSGLMLAPEVLEGLSGAGFEVPSPIQLQAIPLGRAGLDLIVQAKSGTGKTCVFTVIALESIDTENTCMQVVILAPTREIAVQIWEVINSIGRTMEKLRCYVFIGGLNVNDDKLKLKKCHIAVATPGRFRQLIEMDAANVNSVRLFVLDEADKLLEAGFQDDINWIYSALQMNKQMIAASATYPEYLAQQLTTYMRSPKMIRLNTCDPALLGISQYYVLLPFSSLPYKVYEEKSEFLLRLLSSVDFQQCLVFSNYQSRAQSLSKLLDSKGWPSTFICGSQEQEKRLTAMAKLRRYQCRVLISTDLTSRGIDVENVNLVVNLDLPADHETYLHRIGRAGRYGSFGAAVTLVTQGKESANLRLIEVRCQTSIQLLPDPIPEGLTHSCPKVDLTVEVTVEEALPPCHSPDGPQVKLYEEAEDIFVHDEEAENIIVHNEEVESIFVHDEEAETIFVHGISDAGGIKWMEQEFILNNSTGHKDHTTGHIGLDDRGTKSGGVLSGSDVNGVEYGDMKINFNNTKKQSNPLDELPTIRIEQKSDPVKESLNWCSFVKETLPVSDQVLYSLGDLVSMSRSHVLEKDGAGEASESVPGPKWAAEDVPEPADESVFEDVGRLIADSDYGYATQFPCSATLLGDILELDGMTFVSPDERRVILSGGDAALQKPSTEERLPSVEASVDRSAGDAFPLNFSGEERLPSGKDLRDAASAEKEYTLEKEKTLDLQAIPKSCSMSSRRVHQEAQTCRRVKWSRDKLLSMERLADNVVIAPDVARLVQGLCIERGCENAARGDTWERRGNAARGGRPGSKFGGRKQNYGAGEASESVPGPKWASEDVPEPADESVFEDVGRLIADSDYGYATQFPRSATLLGDILELDGMTFVSPDERRVILSGGDAALQKPSTEERLPSVEASVDRSAGDAFPLNFSGKERLPSGKDLRDAASAEKEYTLEKEKTLDLQAIPKSCSMSSRRVHQEAQTCRRVKWSRDKLLSMERLADNVVIAPDVARLVQGLCIERGCENAARGDTWERRGNAARGGRPGSKFGGRKQNYGAGEASESVPGPKGAAEDVPEPADESVFEDVGRLIADSDYGYATRFPCSATLLGDNLELDGMTFVSLAERRVILSGGDAALQKPSTEERLPRVEASVDRSAGDAFPLNFSGEERLPSGKDLRYAVSAEKECILEKEKPLDLQAIPKTCSMSRLCTASLTSEAWHSRADTIVVRSTIPQQYFPGYSNLDAYTSYYWNSYMSHLYDAEHCRQLLTSLADQTRLQDIAVQQAAYIQHMIAFHRTF